MEKDDIKNDDRNSFESFDIEDFLSSLTNKPGVYRMHNIDNEIIYVGKAKHLKKRVSSYFHGGAKNSKTQSLVSQIKKIEVTVTNTEGEALLLEDNLIKEHHPRYNILLRDDKSYPYIYLDSNNSFPRLSFYRGAKKKEGQYFGPYPSAGSVRESLNLLQKVFRIRQCEDSFFKNRTRPCLQYQIKRCTAPCTGMISEDEYAQDLRHAVMFLEGKSSSVVEELVRQMESASETQNYEKAAVFRDQIANLKRVQEKQYISGEQGNIDVVACVESKGAACVQVFFIRDGRNLGNKYYFPKHVGQSSSADVLTAFLPQYYLNTKLDRFIPPEIIINQNIEETELLQQVLSERARRKVIISNNVRRERARWVKMAEDNARVTLNNELANKASLLKRFEELQDVLGLDAMPQRLECFDISHTMGESTVASCVVMDVQGAVKNDYRQFNIKSITPGDDYAAMEQALTRRYTRLKKGEGKLPDILLIDGGKGQVSEAMKVMEELQIENVIVVGVAKGPERKPGLETLVIGHTGELIDLPHDSAALHLIQQIRDEAHRFAITGHRQRRARTRNTSVLEGIEGLGPKRRQQLLKQFGGIQGIKRAGVEDLSSINGISRALAQRIYDYFHME